MLLDVLFSFNIALSLVVLLVAVYAMRPLDFAVFPTILLLTTLLRLALNVASTRVVLLEGHTGPDAAGKVIKSETYTRKSDRSEWTTAIGRTTRKAVGLAIAQARNAAGLSVRDLADRCGLDAGHLCRIENGRMNVTIDTVAKICEALGLRLEAVSASETK